MVYYRLYYFSPRSHGIVKFEEIEAADDAEAETAAQAKRGKLALELWTGTRKVAQIEASDPTSRSVAMRQRQGEMRPAE